MAIRLIIGDDDDGRRLDRVLRKSLGDLPLSAIHRLLRTGRVRVDGRKVGAAERLSAGSVLELPDLEGCAPRTLSEKSTPPPRPEPGRQLEILWEGGGLLVVSKPSGLLIHGPRSLEDRVLAYLDGKLAPSLSFRPGPLHRLDQGTSGLVAFSTSLDGARRFSAALRERLLRKRYLALLVGELRAEEDWEDTLSRNRGGRKTEVLRTGEGRKPEDGKGNEAKAARSRCFPVAAANNRTLAIIEIGTGRTHQIRAQASSRGHPLAGDAKYGGGREAGGFLLHAYELATPRDAALALPPILIAPPGERFRTTTAALFGDKVAEMLTTALPTDAILDAIM